jgi:protein gp37
MGDTTIEWTDKVWNPFRGCSRISKGCGGPGPHGGCYAELMAARFSGPGLPFRTFARMTPSGPRWTGKIGLMQEKLEDPLHWRQPCKIFVNSMSDLFHERAAPDMIQAVFDVIFKARQHTYQILTKRAQRMAKIMPHIRFPGGMKWEDCPEPNVLLGVSVEDQEAAELRIPHLLETPAAVRFLSVEPLLGPVDLSRWVAPKRLNRGWVPGIDWVIVGAESGPRARPMEDDWARSVRDQCAAAGVKFFLKQAVRKGQLVKLPKLDGRRWREFPEVKERVPMP